MKEVNVLVQCRFDLTDSEVAAAARKRAVIEGKMADLDAAFAVQKEKHKNVVGLLEKDAGELGMLIRRGYELRDAECTIIFDYDGGLINTVRVDTGEIVKTRPMTDGEKSKGLPLPLGPAILLSDTDPDMKQDQKTEPGAAPSETIGPDEKGAEDCDNCHHLRTYHLDEDGKDCFCWQPDCDCEAFVVIASAAPPEEAVPDTEQSTACIHCGHPEAVHGQGRKRGCMRADCECKGYVHPDPLGVANVGGETKEAEL